MGADRVTWYGDVETYRLRSAAAGDSLFVFANDDRRCRFQLLSDSTLAATDDRDHTWNFRRIVCPERLK
jgi:hypothetical protein